MSTEAARVALVVDVSVAVIFCCWTLLQMNRTFLVVVQQFVVYAPHLLLRQLIFGRDQTIRHSQRWAEDATQFLGNLHIGAPTPEAKHEDRDRFDSREGSSSALLLDKPEVKLDEDHLGRTTNRSELYLFVKKAIPGVEEVRVQAIATAMLDQSLTLETLKDCFQLPVESQVFQTVVDLLDIPAASLTRGERLRIATFAFWQFKSKS
eukprot:TRINITY_DN8003_c1_g1_i1.p1 TRINITY_DN8003_c1_g1~~TRINITY_DN8003_c1_g1_i1.p1  ORF type:complete len:233 (-),score=34.27 TRINITY_DN8003_c1_g1_i1:474-1094(-)